MGEFNLRYKCRTTGFQNNCGLNCLTHILIEKLLSGELEKRYGNNPVYLEILTSFQEYYELAQPPTWSQLRALFSRPLKDAFDVDFEIRATEHEGSSVDSFEIEEINIKGGVKGEPIAHELILGPVLRIMLAKELYKKKDELWELDFAGAFSNYVYEEKIEVDDQWIVESNEAFFAQARHEFMSRLPAAYEPEHTDAEKLAARALLEKANAENKKVGNPVTPITEDTIAAAITETRTTAVYEAVRKQFADYWHETGAENFVRHMGDINIAQMVLAEHLRVLAEALDMDLEVYKIPPDYDQEKEDNKVQGPWFASNERSPNKWLLKILNTTYHWTYEEPSQSSKKKELHNQPYRIQGEGPLMTPAQAEAAVLKLLIPILQNKARPPEPKKSPEPAVPAFKAKKPAPKPAAQTPSEPAPKQQPKKPPPLPPKKKK